jgi:hypothetical protein
MEFSKELQKDLLNGAVVVYSRDTELLSTVLVRLPKDKFELAGVNNLMFEYKQYQQEINTEMLLTSHRNGSKRDVIKRTAEDHVETKHYLSKENK